MHRYILFAARDGDVLHDQTVCEDEEAAEGWAARRIAEEFRLDDDERHSFDLAFAECDGVLLSRDANPVMDRFVADWASAQVRILASLQEHYGPMFKQERSACLHALVDLVDAVQP